MYVFIFMYICIDRDKYVREASKFWHTFYKRNTDNFYKDRHYLHIVFPELLNQPVIGENSDGRLRLLEVGCGVCIYMYIDICACIRKNEYLYCICVCVHTHFLPAYS
jgi:hypothetical protein